MAEGGGLLNRYRAKSSIEGSNPSLSASAFVFLSLRSKPLEEPPLVKFEYAPVACYAA